MTPAVVFAIVVLASVLLTVYGACVVSGRCSEDERRRRDEWDGDCY